MKKIIFATIFIFITAIPTYATSDESYIQQISDFAYEYDINYDSFKEKPFENIWDNVKRTFKENATKPLNVFFKITAILILSSILNFFVSDSSKQTIKMINILCVLIILCYIFEGFIHISNNVTSVMVNVKNFMVTFIPIFASISFASGDMITSTVYTGFFLLSVIMVANFCIKYILPSVKLFLALGITNSISDVIDLSSICEFYSKAVKLGMTAAVSLLCFILSIQTSITQSQDSLALKTGKFIVSSAVPIIGSSLQGAISSVYASMGVIKGFCGLIGIAIILNIFLPTVIVLVINWLGYYLMISLSKIFDNKSACDILVCFKSVVEIFLSMFVLFMILLIFSLTVMIQVTKGV